MIRWSIAAGAICLTAGCLSPSPCIATSRPKLEPKPQSTRPPIYLPAEFKQRVIDSGGHIDFIFGDDRPFRKCHASTVVQASDGTLLSAWFGGTDEGNDDVGIWMARFENGAWTKPFRIAKVNETAHWNPVLFRDPSRGIFLFFKVGKHIPYWQTFWVHSNESGKTWSMPVELVVGDQGGRGPVKNPPIILSDGAWLAPASTELGGDKPFADRSMDGGTTWERTANFGIAPGNSLGRGAIQPTFWESPAGTVHALLRTGGSHIGRSDSNDGGRTWSPMILSKLLNPDSGICALGLGGGRVVLAYNPTRKIPGIRSPLNLAVSEDDGNTWTDIASLETEPLREFSYPTITRTSKGIAITYSWKRDRIRCWQIPLRALE